MPVAREVLAHAAARPHRLAVRSGHRAVDYAQLGSDVTAVAAALTARGLRPGQLAACDLADPVEMVTAVLATDMVGATPLVCDPAWRPEQRTVVLDALAPAAHLRHLPIHTPRPQLDARTDHVGTGDDLAWAGFSSGSTGPPRAIVRTRRSWVESYSAVSALTRTTGGSTVLVPGPLASSLYCFATFHGLAAGASVVVTGRWSPREARALLADVDVVHLVPGQLEAVTAALETGVRSRLRTAVVGGAGLPAHLRARAEAVGLQVVAYYGAAELSFVAVDSDGTGLRPFPGVDIDVRPMPGAPVGEVWVRSPWVAQGYLAGASGPLRRDQRGWVTVGDLADPQESSNVLSLRGRGDGAVQTGGATVVPEDVEVVLRGVPGIADVVVVGMPHPHLGAVVTAVIESGGAQVRRRELETAARRRLPAPARPRRWLAIERLPRTHTGKPARAVVSDGLATGTLPTRAVP